MMNNCIILILILNLTIYFVNAIPTCPEQYQTYYPGGNKCFSFLPSRAQWITAEQACQQNDGKLAKIENGFDEYFISTQADSFYATYSDNDVWIGLNNLMDTNIYQWTDESIPKYTNWAIGQPLTQGPYCVSLTFKNGSKFIQHWSSENCFDFKFFVCEWNGNVSVPITTTNITVTTTPSTTTTTTTSATTSTSPLITTTLKPTIPTTKLLTTAPITAENVHTSPLPPDVISTTAIVNDETTTPFINPCDYNFTLNHKDGRCYKVFDPRSVPNRDYDNACFFSFSGHLPSIHSPEQNEYIVNLVENAPANMKDNSSFGIAIGLQLVGNAWQWTDGTFIDFLYWNHGPTDGTNRSVIIVDNSDPTYHLWDSTSILQHAYAYVCCILPK